MKMLKILETKQVAVLALCLLVAMLGTAAEPTPGFNQTIPKSILTEDAVDTSIGELRFFDGMPDDETVRKLYDNLDTIRATDVFLNMVPAASLEGIRRGLEGLGVTKPNQVMMFDQLLDSNPLFLTGNTDTVYSVVIFDLSRDGPVVVEIPPGSGPSTVNDAYFRFVTDMGAPGPDRGKGGKYLILPHDYEGDIPKGYFTATSPSAINLMVLRGFLVDGKTDAAVRSVKEALKIYPLNKKDNPPEMKFISGSKIPFNTVHANDSSFFDEINDVIQREPVGFLDPELRGQLASIGIQKGKPFEPDARMQRLLRDGIAIGNATARALLLQPRDKTAYLYDDRRWYSAFIGGDYQWLIAGGDGGRNLDARTAFFYGYTLNTPAMVMKMVGAGSQYAVAASDQSGNYLDGSKFYRIRIPPNVPAKDFWSMVVYDPQTRSELQTGQPFPSKNNKRDSLIVDKDGSIELYFGPTAPDGKAANWIQTVPGKGWWAIFRLYGPLDAWFDREWRPGDFELIGDGFGDSHDH
ncbi:hypothetical protein GCM10007052_23140 [Halioglobus japonicus]|nr:DUF1254 domain-containing protein [Halioglobus japonicus]GHD17056.1 hypothetical protein GCM10007052_23140 [Halioglobus japonicus]